MVIELTKKEYRELLKCIYCAKGLLLFEMENNSNVKQAVHLLTEAGDMLLEKEFIDRDPARVL